MPNIRVDTITLPMGEDLKLRPGGKDNHLTVCYHQEGGLVLQFIPRDHPILPHIEIDMEYGNVTVKSVPSPVSIDKKV